MARVCVKHRPSISNSGIWLYMDFPSEKKRQTVFSEISQLAKEDCRKHQRKPGGCMALPSSWSQNRASEYFTPQNSNTNSMLLRSQGNYPGHVVACSHSHCYVMKRRPIMRCRRFRSFSLFQASSGIFQVRGFKMPPVRYFILLNTT